jgi:hypothetical protein
MYKGNDHQYQQAPDVSGYEGLPTAHAAVHLQKETEAKKEGKQRKEFSEDEHIVYPAKDGAANAIVFGIIFDG